MTDSRPLLTFILSGDSANPALVAVLDRFLGNMKALSATGIGLVQVAAWREGQASPVFELPKLVIELRAELAMAKARIAELETRHPPPPPDVPPLRWPTDYRVVTQPFGARPEVYAPLGVPAHEGIDMRAPLGTNVYAAGDGVVTRVEAANRAYGVSVRHSWEYQGRTFELVYAHGVPGSVTVKVGDSVKSGDILMKADSTGNSSGSHLHFSMKEPGVTFTDRDAQGKPRAWPFNILDPLPFLGL